MPFVTKARMRMHRENDIARTIRPREAEEEDRWSSRSERIVVEGRRPPSFVVGAGGLQRWSCFVLLESKRASLMSAHDDNFLAASRPAPHLGAAEAEDAGGVGIFRRSFRYLIPGNKSPALIAGCLHLSTVQTSPRGDGWKGGVAER